MPPDALHPRWYLSFCGFVWGAVCGAATVAFLYESTLWHVGGSWRVQSFPLLVIFVPTVLLAGFEVVFRVRRHLRLRRQLDIAGDARDLS